LNRDPELVKRCLDGEEDAWEALLDVHTRRIYNLCYRFTGRYEDAEDLTQEIFIKVFHTLRTYDLARSSFSVWLNRVARNHLIDHYRRTRKDRATSPLDDHLATLEQIPYAGESPAFAVESRERKERLQASLNRLSPELREAVILRDLQDMDYSEIAKVLGILEGTVKSRINCGRLELARVLKRME
jgi:RNA polymerase sigma factor (sigma-70 family)